MSTEAADTPHTLALPPRSVLADRFRLQRPLQGGSPYAITYRAEDLTRGEPVIVKEFFPRSLVSRAGDGVAVRPHSPEDERHFVRALRRFEIEGAVLAEVAHPHIVRARGLVDANGTAYLVMDQHRSQPLAEYVQANGGRLAPAQAGRLIQHLLTALEPLHAESIIHRDLSPRSVHVHGDGAVLLLEFSARRHLPLHGTDLAAGFAAFEQYGMRDIGPWTDVYAVSALLYYLLTGATPPSALDRAAGEALASPTALVPNLSPALARLVLRGLALLPQQRPHAASELRRQLETALGEGVLSGGRSAQPGSPFDSLGAFADVAMPDADDRTTSLKLAAGGIVLPGESGDGSGLLRRLGSAASRFRRTPVVPTSPAPVAREEPRMSPPIDEPRPVVVHEPAPMAAPTPIPQPAVTPDEAPPFAEPRPAAAAALVPADERAMPVLEERAPQYDLATQIALAAREGAYEAPVPSRRRQYSLLAAGLLVVAVGGSLAFLARNGSASSSGIRTEAAATRSAAPAPDPAASSRTAPQPHEVVEAGAVLQNAHPDAKAAHSETEPSKVSTPAPSAPRRTPAATRDEPVLPAARLPNVRVSVQGPAADLKLVSPEALVDVRTRLVNGQEQVDQGEYVLARRAFRLALLQLDSIATKYPDSEKIRGLRRELEQADARALQACGAENEMRQRRGEEVKACQ